MSSEAEHTAVIEGCQRGDRKAQEALYKAYYRSMVTICLRYTKNEEDAVEVLNNGFLKVFKNIQRYEPAQASLYTWIRTIVVRSCLDHIRLKQRLVPHEELLPETDVNIPPSVISSMKAGEILELVRGLPPATGAVFNLYAIEGYTHKEIGALLNISEGTSKWHLSTARKALQRAVEQQDVNQA